MNKIKDKEDSIKRKDKKKDEKKEATENKLN